MATLFHGVLFLFSRFLSFSLVTTVTPVVTTTLRVSPSYVVFMLKVSPWSDNRNISINIIRSIFRCVNYE